MECSTILRTQTGFGKDTLNNFDPPPLEKDIKYNQTPTDPIETWYSVNRQKGRWGVGGRSNID